MIKSNYIKPFLKLNKVFIGKKVDFYGIPFIYRCKEATIDIGDRVVIKSSFLSNLVGLYQRTIILARANAKIVIGKNVGISASTIYSRKSITIGDNTLIGANTKILDHDFHPLDVEARINNDYSKVKSKEIIIGKNAFIGTGCIILKGTVIGDNCIVGAGSVVAGKFESNTVIAGNPARVIKKIEE